MTTPSCLPEPTPGVNGPAVPLTPLPMCTGLYYGYCHTCEERVLLDADEVCPRARANFYTDHDVVRLEELEIADCPDHGPGEVVGHPRPGVVILDCCCDVVVYELEFGKGDDDDWHPVRPRYDLLVIVTWVVVCGAVAWFGHLFLVWLAGGIARTL